VLPVFATNRRVIALEEQGHGRTTDRDAPVAFESSADDVAALLRHLKVDQADIFGFSNGASVALQVAIRHPDLVRRMVFASSITKRAGAQPQLWEFMKRADFSNMPQPLKDAFLRVNPNVQQLKTMHDKDAARMQSFKDVPDDSVRSVRAPTLIVLGDQDIVKPEHAVELTRLISGARLLVLPGGHGDYLGEAVMTQKPTRYPELTARLIDEFLDSEWASPGSKGDVIMSTGTVRLHRVLRAAPEKIYRAFLDPDAMVKWLPPNGFTGRIHHIDAKVGGTYKMSFTNFTTGQSHSFGGTYLELMPHERIRHTDKFDDPSLPGEMHTTISLKKVSVGTEVNVVQEGIPEAIPPEACYLGWQESLTLLTQFVEAEIRG
jgi:pimeloyl-ACP methyl ester carboxylesterase/uncharacterized protein YndB with AHSA1/START domain